MNSPPRASAHLTFTTLHSVQLNLSDNRLCGLWLEYGTYGEQMGTYTAEGIIAIAEALKVTASMTRVDVRGNGIVGDGASQLSAAVLANVKIEVFNEIPVKEMRADSFTELDLSKKNIGVAGGMVVAGLIPVMASVTKILVGGNRLRDEGTIILCDALRESTVSKVEELSLYTNGIGPDGAKAIAALCIVCASVTSVWTPAHQP